MVHKLNEGKVLGNVVKRITALLASRDVPERKRKKELARICGISYEAVRKWFSGDTQTIEIQFLEMIASHYSGSVSWLRTGRGDMNEVAAKEVVADQARFVEVPVFAWAEVEDGRRTEVLDWVPVPRKHLKSTANVFATIYSGDEMQGLKGQNIPDESIIVIDPDAEIMPRRPVLARTSDDQLVVRNYGVNGSQIMLHTANTAYPSAPLGDGHIIGAVVVVVMPLGDGGIVSS